MSKDSIVDASKPNAGRIYDYFLGGHHNFEVDRQAAEKLFQLLPFAPKAARLQRWCLQDLAVELVEKRGFDVIIDFASGLPTQDHIHKVVPEGTTVIYSDYDPVTVEYAHGILADTPNVYYYEADARQPEDLLSRSEVKEILGDRRDVGLVTWGLSAFITDEELSKIADFLSQWAGPRSCWVFNAQIADADPNNPAWVEVSKIYEQMGQQVYIRSLERSQELFQPWQLDETGFISLLEWHGYDESEMTKQDREAYGPGGVGYGVYLIK